MLNMKDAEDKDLRLLEQCLPKLGKSKRAYLKGAAKALFYAQEAVPAGTALTAEEFSRRSRRTTAEHGRTPDDAWRSGL